VVAQSVVSPLDTVSRLKRSLDSVIKGKSEVIERVLVSLFAGGHVLIEDVPGVGKTTLAKAIARSCDIHCVRVQFARYMLALITATRTHRDLALGASPHATIALFRASQAMAFVRGRDYVSPDDVQCIARGGQEAPPQELLALLSALARFELRRARAEPLEHFADRGAASAIDAEVTREVREALLTHAQERYGAEVSERTRATLAAVSKRVRAHTAAG